jgi:hypothetical protein
MLVVLVGGLSLGSSAWGCSFAAPTYTITGRAIDRDGEDVTFLVVDAEDLEGSGARLPELGAQVEIRFASGDAAFLSLGTDYRVPVVRGPTSGHPLYSEVRSHSGGCHGVLTTHADGSPVDTGLLSSAAVREWAPGAIAIVALMAAGVGVLLWRRRGHHLDPVFDA